MHAAGAWSNLREGDDINTMSRSQNEAYLATGDNHGNISVYRHPCTAERVRSKLLKPTWSIRIRWI